MRKEEEGFHIELDRGHFSVCLACGRCGMNSYLANLGIYIDYTGAVSPACGVMTAP